MDPGDVLLIKDIVDELVGRVPSADETEIANHVHGTVKAIARQKACEQVAPSAVNKRLTMIREAVRKLDRLLYDDHPGARAAGRAMAKAVGEAEFEELRRCLADLASGRGLENVEFAPKLQCGAEEYARSVGEAAGALSALLSQNSSYARAMRRDLRSSAIEKLHGRLQDLATASASARIPTETRLSAFFAPAEVARYDAKVSSGGRPTETAKLVAVWGSSLLLVKLGLPLTEDPDDLLSRLSAMIYETATGERDPDLSHAVKRFLHDMRARKVID